MRGSKVLCSVWHMHLIFFTHLTFKFSHTEMTVEWPSYVVTNTQQVLVLQSWTCYAPVSKNKEIARGEGDVLMMPAPPTEISHSNPD